MARPVLDALKSTLTSDEHERADRFRFPQDLAMGAGLSAVLSIIQGTFERRTSLGLRKALRRALLEFQIQRAHRLGLRQFKHRRSEANELKLHIGCGPNIKHGWINIDLFRPDADLNLDMRERLPFPDNSVVMIYGEHFLEYLEYPDEVANFLNEAFRVLTLGGQVSLGVVNVEWVFASYLMRNEQYLRWARTYWNQPWCKTFLDHVNEHLLERQKKKRFYDFETLRDVLARVGFVSIERRPFDPKIDMNMGPRREESLFVDARKPI